MEKLTLLFVLLAVFLPFPLDSRFSNKQVRWNRSRRQAPIGILNPPIPTSISHFIGNNQPIDKCPRDEVLFSDGLCHPLLTQGPCTINQYLLLDPTNSQPYCAERLCGPDRIFLFSDQLCHDPRSGQLCPPGREMYETLFGTPICQCPTGTYESDDDLDDDVCDPLLGQTLTCPPGQVFWFRDFSLPPECLPDPCGGDNLNRGPNDQPFVPFSDGRCFQIGTMPNVCPAQTWYTLALQQLEGVCSSLEDAGYIVYDEATLKQLIDIYGPPIARDSTSPIPTPGSFSDPAFGAGGTATPAGGAGAPVTSGSSVGSGIPGGFGGPGVGSQGTLTGRPSAGGLGTSGGVARPSSQGIFTGGSSSSGQETQSGGFGSGSQGTFSQGVGSISQGTFGQGINAGSQGTVGQGSSTGSQGSFGQGIGASNQGGFGQGTGTVSQGNINQGLGSGSQGTFGQGTGAGSKGRPITFPGSSSSPGYSPRPANPFADNVGSTNPFADNVGSANPFADNVGSANPFADNVGSPNPFANNAGSVNPFADNAGGSLPHSGSPPFTVMQGHPPSLLISEDSDEMFGLYDNNNPIFPTPGHSPLSSVVRDASDLNIREGRLLADIDVASTGPSSQDVALLQAPPGHKLHGFFNSVRTLVNSGPHNRSRRASLPHSSPGNVFETRLVGCRAGAQRDVNAKCRDTVLPSMTPASRPARAVPPVPPSPGCPSGQSFNIQRMCEATGSAVDSVNRFNLG